MAYTRDTATKTMFREYPDVVSITQLSEMLHISEKTAYRLLQDNKIAHFKIGRVYRIPKVNVLFYMSIIS